MVEGTEGSMAIAKFSQVYSREIDEINNRRKFLKRPEVKPEVIQTLAPSSPGWLRSLVARLTKGGGTQKKEDIYKIDLNAKLVSLALSGGGIRSASFCLGALQALEVNGAIKNIDIMSTVSGGGYIGTSMTAAMTRGDGSFPFPSKLETGEPAPLKHIRDHSNFLIPDGFVDVLAAITTYFRGIVTNVVVLLPWLLVLAALTIILNPNKDALTKSGPIANALQYILEKIFHTQLDIANLTYFRVSTIFLAITFVALLIWIIVESGPEILKRYLGTGDQWTSYVGALFLLVILSAFCEAQPIFINALMIQPGQQDGSLVEKLIGLIQPWIQHVSAWIAALGAALAFFNKTFEGWIKSATQNPRLRDRLLGIAGKIGVYIASLAIPLIIWLAYIELTRFGILLASPEGLEVSAANSAIIRELLSASESQVFGPGLAIHWKFLLVAVFLFLLSLLFNPNRTSLHRLYRDRLSKAFLFDMPLLTAGERAQTFFAKAQTIGIGSAIRQFVAGKRLSTDVPPLDHIKLSELSSVHTPYQIINSALNIQNSKYVNRRGRNAEFFMFSSKFTGSVATGYAETREVERKNGDLDVATAVAISGAAFSSNMGSNSIRPMTPTLTMLNIRLGFWLRNPNWSNMSLKPLWQVIDLCNLYFFMEMFGRLREDSWRVYLTDGGHIENLGIYELIKRRCKLIVAIDAEADAKMNFSSFVKLERYARIDLGIIIDLPWRRLQAVTLDTGKAIAENGGPAYAETRKGPHCVVGQIKYPDGDGYLLYVKSSLSGDENDYIQNYKRNHGSFPHETTGDQFFSEEQFEVYRALGFHALSGFFNGTAEVPTFCDRKSETGPTPPLYARRSVPDSQTTIDEVRRLLLGLPDPLPSQNIANDPA